MASKDYAAWHAKKIALNNSVSQAYFYEREVWWVAIGQNVGDEEDGKGYNFARPVLICENLTSRYFMGYRYRLPISAASITTD